MALHTGAPVPSALSQTRVQNAEGQRVELGTLWAKGPCALVFLRHFGCPACAEHVSEVLPRLLELRALGVRVALVGSGAPEHIGPFAERVGLEGRPIDLLTDPTLAAFRAAGLVRSAWSTYQPASLVRVARAMTRGHAHLPPQGDALQQGGTVLVDQEGRVAFYHRNESVGGDAPLVTLVDAALAVVARSSANVY
jgi:peroxiredoxin